MSPQDKRKTVRRIASGISPVLTTQSDRRTRWSLDRQHAHRIGAAVGSATADSYAEIEIEIPFEPKRGRA